MFTVSFRFRKSGLRAVLVSSYLFLLFRILPVKAGHPLADFPSNITISAAVIPGDTFRGFQSDLLDRLVVFASEDNVTLRFRKEEVQEEYNLNLEFIAPECDDGESVFVNDIEYSCSAYDMIVGDYWPNDSRYSKVDFTPPWLHTSISALKYVEKTKHPELDVTTFTQAAIKGVSVCVRDLNTYHGKALAKMFPNGINLVPCANDGISAADNCIKMLKTEECMLWVSDELVLLKEQADDPTLEMTGERLQRQLLAWPVRKNLDPTVSFLLNKWMYAAIRNQTVSALYFEYFEKKLCPIGTAGGHCELPCDPDHGMANAAGKCICDSTKYIGDDCSVEVPEELNLIPPPVKAIAYSMLGFNLLVILICTVWLYWKRKTPQVQVSSPIFLLLVLLGCLISSCAIIAMAQDDAGDGPVSACMAIPWLYSVGFSVTFGTLFAKILRMYRLFTQYIFVAGRDAMIVRDTANHIGVVLLMDVIILVLWTVLDPLQWQRVVIREDVFGDVLESQGHCTSDSWPIFAGLIGALHLSLMAIASYMCFCARNIPSRYSEHRFVSIAMLSNLQIFVVGVPVLVIVAGDPGSMLFVRSVIVWMNDLVVVSLIFGNLMYSVHVGPKSGSGDTEESKAQIEAAVRLYSSHLTTGNPHTGAAVSVGAVEVPSLSSTNAPPIMSPPCTSLLMSSLSLSEMPISEYDYEDHNNAVSQRFVTEGCQDAPLKPKKRPSADEIMQQPERQPRQRTSDTTETSPPSPTSTPRSPHSRHCSLDSCLTSKRIDLTSSRCHPATPPPSDRGWHSGRVQHLPVVPRRRAVEDSTMMMPSRQPSDFIDDSEVTTWEEDLGRKATLPQVPTSSLMQAAILPPSLFETTAAKYQTSGQSSGQRPAFRPNNGNVVATLPRKPVRLASTAETESGCNSDDEVLRLEEPKLERITSRGSLESDDTPPAEPMRIMSSIDLDSENSSGDKANQTDQNQILDLVHGVPSNLLRIDDEKLALPARGV